MDIHPVPKPGKPTFSRMRVSPVMDLTSREKQIAKAAYFMGFKSANAVHDRELNEQVEKCVDLLISIANGETTFQATGSELRSQNASVPKDIEYIIRENKNVERAIAEAILKR